MSDHHQHHPHSQHSHHPVHASQHQTRHSTHTPQLLPPTLTGSSGAGVPPVVQVEGLDDDARMNLQQLILSTLPQAISSSVKEALKSHLPSHVDHLRREIRSLADSIVELRENILPYLTFMQNNGPAGMHHQFGPQMATHYGGVGLEVDGDDRHGGQVTRQRGFEDEKKFKDHCREAAKLFLDLSTPWSSQKPLARKNATKMVADQCGASEEDIHSRFKKYLTHIKSYHKRTSRQKQQSREEEAMPLPVDLTQLPDTSVAVGAVSSVGMKRKATNDNSNQGAKRLKFSDEKIEQHSHPSSRGTPPPPSPLVHHHQETASDFQIASTVYHPNHHHTPAPPAPISNTNYGQ